MSKQKNTEPTKTPKKHPRDYSPTPQEKKLLENLNKWEKRSEESLKDCIVGLPLPKPWD